MTDDLAVLEDYIQRCSNWGRWGPDDQLGTVNLITPDKIREGAALVKVGKTISLTMPYDEHGPQTGYLGRTNPHLYQLTSGPGYLVGEQQRVEIDTLAQWRESTGQPTAGYYDDVLVMPTQSGTQWDALCHFFWRGQMYNGHWAGDAGTAGSRSNGVQNYTGKIITRGGVRRPGRIPRRGHPRARIRHHHGRSRRIPCGEKPRNPARRRADHPYRLHGSTARELGRLRRWPITRTIPAHRCMDP